MEVMKKGSSYLTFLHFLQASKVEGTCVMFWKEAEDFRKKFTSQHDSMASAEDAEAIYKDAADIFRKYIGEAAQVPIPTTPGIRVFIEGMLSKPHSHMFMMAQSDCVPAILVKFREFVKTDFGKSALKAVPVVKK